MTVMRNVLEERGLVLRRIFVSVLYDVVDCFGTDSDGGSSPLLIGIATVIISK